MSTIFPELETKQHKKKNGEPIQLNNKFSIKLLYFIGYIFVFVTKYHNRKSLK